MSLEDILNELTNTFFEFINTIPDFIIAYQGNDFCSFFKATVLLSCNSCLFFEKVVPHKQAPAKFDLWHLGYSENLIKAIKKIASIFDKKTILIIIAHILLIIYFLIEIEIKYKKFYF